MVGDAVVKQRARGEAGVSALIESAGGETLTVEADPFGVHGGEAIYADGALVGRITSAAWGYTVEKNIAMSYLSDELAVEGTALEVDIRGKRVAAEVVKLPFYRRER